MECNQMEKLKLCIKKVFLLLSIKYNLVNCEYIAEKKFLE